MPLPLPPFYDHILITLGLFTTTTILYLTTLACLERYTRLHIPTWLPRVHIDDIFGAYLDVSLGAVCVLSRILCGEEDHMRRWAPWGDVLLINVLLGVYRLWYTFDDDRKKRARERDAERPERGGEDEKTGFERG